MPLYLFVIFKVDLPLPILFSQSNTFFFLLPVMLVAVGLRWVLTRAIVSFDQTIDWLAKKLG